MSVTVANTALNPQPTSCPYCSECGIDYVLRRAIVFNAKPGSRSMTIHSEWVWQRDCKHRKAAPKMASAKTSRRKETSNG